MHRRLGYAVVSIALAVVPAASALAAAPLTELLAGKTCQGTFDTGRKQEASKGALQLRFAVESGGLTAQVARLVGAPAYDRAAYAMTRGQAADASGYEQLGAARDLRVAGHTILYVDPLGAKVSLGYKHRRLDGQSDPRGGSDPRMTRVAFVRLLCR